MADNTKTASVNGTAPPPCHPKRRSPMHIFKVASILMRRGSPEPKKQSKGRWKKLLGSVRLLHLQETESPRPTMENQVKMKPDEADVGDRKECTLPLRRDRFSSSPSRSSIAASSRYHSVENLQELAESEEEEEEEECWYDGGDSMIDSKAELFISQFYEQMRLQKEAIRK